MLSPFPRRGKGGMEQLNTLLALTQLIRLQSWPFPTPLSSSLTWLWLPPSLPSAPTRASPRLHLDSYSGPLSPAFPPHTPPKNHYLIGFLLRLCKGNFLDMRKYLWFNVEWKKTRNETTYNIVCLSILSIYHLSIYKTWLVPHQICQV